MSFEFLDVFLILISGVLLESWKIFVEAAPYLIFGLGIAGILNILVPDQKIVDYLGASAGKVRSVVNASLAGLPLATMLLWSNSCSYVDKKKGSKPRCNPYPSLFRLLRQE